MPQTVVELEFSAGQAALTFRSLSDEVRIKNHWLNDRFADLVNCVELLIDEVEAVCCRWPGPVNDGHFIDLVRDPAGGLSVAVHAFRYPDGIESSEIWSAGRGDLIFSMHLEFSEFVLAFAAALRSTRVTAVDRSGLLHEYPRPFPSAALERIERRAARLGYQPTPLSEIENPSLYDE